MTPDATRRFVHDNHRAVLITHRRDGTLQTSPVAVGLDGFGNAVVSSRETAMKTKNLRRDSRATLCVFTDDWWGDWIQIEGPATVLSLPEAMEPLVDYYRGVAGEHPDWAEYRKAMERERRVLIRIAMDRVGPQVAG